MFCTHMQHSKYVWLIAEIVEAKKYSSAFLINWKLQENLGNCLLGNYLKVEILLLNIFFIVWGSHRFSIHNGWNGRSLW